MSDGSTDDIEIMVVEADISEHKIRFINGYGPQENAPVDERIKFFARLEEEIIISQISGCLTCVELDANAKLGPDVIIGPGLAQGSTFLWLKIMYELSTAIAEMFSTNFLNFICLLQNL